MVLVESEKHKVRGDPIENGVVNGDLRSRVHSGVTPPLRKVPMNDTIILKGKPLKYVLLVER